MRTILFVAALSMSGVAFAQTEPTPPTTEPTEEPATEPTPTPPDTPEPDTTPPDTTMPSPTPDATPPDTAPPTATTPDTPPPATPPASSAMPSMPSSVEPGNTNPEKDARGISVISAPAAAPAGANQPPAPGATAVPSSNQAAVFAAQPSAKEYPPCSKTVTDNCVQTYERGRR